MLICVPPKANPETRKWVQVVYEVIPGSTNEEVDRKGRNAMSKRVIAGETEAHSH